MNLSADGRGMDGGDAGLPRRTVILTESNELVSF